MEGSSGDASTLKVDDEVEFLLHDDFKIDQQSAIHIKLLVKAEEKRELGQVNYFLSPFLLQRSPGSAKKLCLYQISLALSLCLHNRQLSVVYVYAISLKPW